MALHVRTGSTGGKFVQIYEKAEQTLKKQARLLDSKHKKICEQILKDGEKFWGKVEANSRKDYEDMIESYVKEATKAYQKVEDYMIDQIKKAG